MKRTIEKDKTRPQGLVVAEINGPKCETCGHHQLPAHKPRMVHVYKSLTCHKRGLKLLPALELSTGCREPGCACRAFRLVD